VYHLDTREGIEHMKSTQFTLKEGCKYRFIISFRVNRTIVSGLRFKNKAKKAMHSSVDEIMIGSYAPRTLPYTFVYPRHDWIDAPSGMLSRGKYLAQFQVCTSCRLMQ
jgi:Rho GDP-dissociation inhibitor